MAGKRTAKNELSQLIEAVSTGDVKNVDSLLAASIIMMPVYVFRIDWMHSGYCLFVVGVGCLVRAILMALTPLGQPVGNNETMASACC